MFENHRKSLIQHCERSELRLHFEWTKVNWKCQKWSILESFWKPEACGQTVLPDSSILIGQKLVENAKIKNSNVTFWVLNFQKTEIETWEYFCSFGPLWRLMIMSVGRTYFCDGVLDP